MTISALLLYPPLQFAPGAVPKPDGSLGIAYVAGALLRAGFKTHVLDAAVGQDGEAFDRRQELPSGLVRVGLSDDDIVQACAQHDIIGIGSTFTAQHTMALETTRLIADALPDKPILIGGVSARHFAEEFIEAGADMVFPSEADASVAQVAANFVGGPYTLRPSGLVTDLDELPLPAWHLLPNEAYWRIGRPHGGAFGEPIKYAAMMTSRGCPYQCSFCHISVETEGSASGAIGKFRVKSLPRVLQELDALQDLGVDHVYIEDDSLLAKKSRILEIFRTINDRGMKLADVNGVNIAHLFRNEGGKLIPDTPLIEAMADCGFTELSLPFESASERMLVKYASRKWSPSRVDTVALVREMVRVGIAASGNYMIGFPDETEEEIQQTIDMARRHREAGLSEANFFLVVPFPGTVLFDQVRREGYLHDDWDPDDMLWFKPIMRGTTVPHGRLKELRDRAWEDLNAEGYVGARREAAL